jgi:hypothetical protein
MPLYFEDTLLQTLPQSFTGADPTVLSYLPGTVYSLLSGYNLAGVWQSVAAAVSLNEDGALALQQTRDGFRLFTGLDLD